MSRFDKLLFRLVACAAWCAAWITDVDPRINMGLFILAGGLVLITWGPTKPFNVEHHGPGESLERFLARRRGAPLLMPLPVAFLLGMVLSGGIATAQWYLTMRLDPTTTLLNVGSTTALTLLWVLGRYYVESVRRQAAPEEARHQVYDELCNLTYDVQVIARDGGDEVSLEFRYARNPVIAVQQVVMRPCIWSALNGHTYRRRLEDDYQSLLFQLARQVERHQLETHTMEVRHG